jgi:hypothetical protein
MSKHNGLNFTLQVFYLLFEIFLSEDEKLTCNDDLQEGFGIFNFIAEETIKFIEGVVTAKILKTIYSILVVFGQNWFLLLCIGVLGKA